MTGARLTTWDITPLSRPAPGTPLVGGTLVGGRPITEDSLGRDISTSSAPDVHRSALTRASDQRRLYTEVVRLPSPAPGDTAITLERWEGRVDRVTHDSFLATLIDLSLEGQEEIAEFDLSEVSKQDRSFAQERSSTGPSAGTTLPPGNALGNRSCGSAGCPPCRRLRSGEPTNALANGSRVLAGATTDWRRPPDPDEVEVSLFGLGEGESVL